MARGPGVSGVFNTQANRWLEQNQSAFAAAGQVTQIFPEIVGNSPKSANIPFSPTLTMVGANNSFTNNSLSAEGSLIQLFSEVEEFPDFISLVIDMALASDGGPGDLVELNVFLSGIGLGSILGTATEVVTDDLFDVSARVQNELFREVISLPTASLPTPTDMVSLGIVRDATAGNPADTFSGNLTILGYTLFLPNFSVPEEIRS